MKHKSGFVSIIGYPNAGKSTLVNALVGEKLSIVNAKVQTTRDRILGIYNSKNYQIVFSDTPGIIDPKYKLQKKMMSYVMSSFVDSPPRTSIHCHHRHNKSYQKGDLTIK